MRTVEVFTAGCPLCDEAVQLVTELSCPSCQVTVYNLAQGEGLGKARGHGVTSVPSIVVDGQMAPCCQRGTPDAEQLKAMGIGQPYP